MDITKVYAIAAGGALATLVLIRFLPYLIRLTCRITPLISKHLTYPYFLDRHQLFGPWTRAGVLIHLLYVLVNVFCLCFPVSSTSAAGRRAGTLSLVNMAFLFAGAHLSFVADLLGVSLRTCRRIHCAAGWVASALLIFHVLVVVFNRADFPIHESNNLFAIIVCRPPGYARCRSQANSRQGAVSLGTLLLTFLPLFQRLAYEIFLRIHQALAGLCIYAVWRHLPSDALFPRLYVYIMAGVFLLTFILQSAVFFYRNGAFGSGGCPRALITHDNNAIKICVVLSRPMKVDAGQYINLWIPNVSFWSWVQSHPFVITSWSRGKQNTLDLFVEPRRGLSADLLRHARADSQGTSSFLALFSGPHGITESVANYESVVTVASGFGIAAVIPYLKQLIFGYNTCTSRTRRVHLVWQLRTLSKTESTILTARCSLYQVSELPHSHCSTICYMMISWTTVMSVDLRWTSYQ